MNKSIRETNADLNLGNTKKWRGGTLFVLAALAASAVIVRNKTREAESKNPPQGKFVEVDGIQLHYVERGEGPPLVLLHGNGVMAKDFDISGLSKQAAERYRVILFDRPGYGYSERPRNTIWTPIAQAKLLHNALQKLGIENPVVLGHSWGTLVALAMALEFPSYVRGLVLLSGYYYPSLRLDTAFAAQPAIPIVGDLMRYTISPLLGRLMWPVVTKKLFSPSAVPPRFNALPAWMVLRPSQLRASAAESALMVPAAMMLYKRYYELTMPVSIIAGEGDQIVNAEKNSGRLHDELPQSDLQLSPDLGHMVHYGMQDKVMAAIDAIEKTPMPQQAVIQNPADATSDEVRLH